jgi:sugar lactone lactonase YvrE
MTLSVRILLAGVGVVLGLAWPHAQTPGDQGSVTPVNDLPNPYQTIDHWAKLPDGRVWGATSGVGIDQDGKSVWVAERCGGNSACWDGASGTFSALDPVMKFGPNGTLGKSFGAGVIVWPHGLSVDRNGDIWATDYSDNLPRLARGAAANAPMPARPPKIVGHQVYKFSPDGTVLLTLGKPGGGREPDFFYQPNAVCIAPDGTVFVSEGHASTPGSTARVLKFSKDGKLIRSFGSLGSGPDQFDQPHALAMDSRGRLFVADRNNNRVQIFDRDFTLLDTWYQFSRPSGIFIDANDIIYVADSESESVSRMAGMRGHEGWKRGIRIGSATDGSVKYFIPDPVENASGQSSPEGIAVDASGAIYGAEVGERALEKYVRK